MDSHCPIGLPVRRGLPDVGERLEHLGITPLAPEPAEPAKPSTTPAGAFERDVAALAHYKAR
ncbi:hypothetical protein ACWDZ8_43175 [Streptomyces sp. NPDC003233]